MHLDYVIIIRREKACFFWQSQGWIAKYLSSCTSTRSLFRKKDFSVKFKMKTCQSSLVLLCLCGYGFTSLVMDFLLFFYFFAFFFDTVLCWISVSESDMKGLYKKMHLILWSAKLLGSSASSQTRVQNTFLPEVELGQDSYAFTGPGQDWCELSHCTKLLSPTPWTTTGFDKFC